MKTSRIMKKTTSAIIAFAMSVLVMPTLSATGNVTSTVYTVGSNTIANVYPQTLVYDFKNNITASEKKILRNGTELLGGYVESGDVLKAGESEYTITLKDTVLFNPMDTVKNLADGTVLYEKATDDSFATTPLADYGFFNSASGNRKAFAGKTLKVTKVSADGVPYYEMKTDSSVPAYFRGTRMSDYTRTTTNIGKYIVFEMDIVPVTTGGYGFMNYFQGSGAARL